MLVIGGGVIGLSVALFLRRRGVAVHVVERGRAGRQTSWGNCGLITPSHADPLTQPASLLVAARSLVDAKAPLRIVPTTDLRRIAWLMGFARRCHQGHRRKARAARAALLQRTCQLLDEVLGDDAATVGWSATGLTTIYRERVHLDRAVALHEALSEHGVAFDVWSAEALREREPLVRADVAGAIFARSDGHVDPGALCAYLAETARAEGVKISEGVVVHRLITKDRRIIGIDTSRGPLGASTTVLAAGPWSPELARGVGLSLPIQPGKGYSITWPRPVLDIRTPLYFYERKVVATPWDHGFRLGSTMEFAGYDSSLDRARLSLLLEGARAYLDHPLELGPGRDWTGWRPMSVDEIPLIGGSRRRPGLMLACGHGMMGVGQSLATGQLVAELLTGSDPHVDPAPYDPGRFGL